MNRKTHSERISILEHEIQGNGSIGIRDQIKEMRAEIRTITRTLYAIIAFLLIIFGEKFYQIIKHL